MDLTTHHQLRNGCSQGPTTDRAAVGSFANHSIELCPAPAAATGTTPRRHTFANPWIVAGIAGFAGFAIAETCLASAANFTVLHQATITLTSLNGSPVSSSVTFTGPATDTSSYPFSQQPIGNLSQANTGSASITINSPFAGTDGFGAFYSSPSGGSGDTYDLAFSWDVTFNSSTGSVRWWGNLFPTGTFTITPLGGTTTPFSDANAPVLLNGRYTITWQVNETTPASGAGGVFWFEEVAVSPVPGGAGLAALAFGASGLRNRRRGRH